MADELGVTRQTISRWLVAPGWERQKIPGWAGQAMLVWWIERSASLNLSVEFKVWWHQIVTPQADKGGGK